MGLVKKIGNSRSSGGGKGLRNNKNGSTVSITTLLAVFMFVLFGLYYTSMINETRNDIQNSQLLQSLLYTNDNGSKEKEQLATQSDVKAATTTTKAQQRLLDTSDDTTTLVKRRKMLGDGCYNVFLDVGANIGIHGRFLFEPDKYPDAGLAKWIFNTHFGENRDNRDYCVFGFEPNPAHNKKLNDNEEAYRNMGWRYQVVRAGVSDKTGNLTFYHMADEDNMEWGFNALESKGEKDIGRGKGKPRNETIPMIRLSDWILNEITYRQIPTTHHGAYNGTAPPPPKVLMKLDVEGLEYIVLPDLLVTGALCNTVDFLFPEIHVNHNSFYPVRFPENNLYLPDKRSAREHLNSIWSFIDKSNKISSGGADGKPLCKTTYRIGDDESYLADGIPLPKPEQKQGSR